MSECDRREFEDRAKSAAESGDYRRAATLALQGFGGEMLRYFRAQLRSESHADDAYLQFSEDLWRGLPSFRWQSSLRVWMFVLARNCAIRVGKSRKREVPVGEDDSDEQALERPRTTTALYRRTEVKDRVRELRLRLPEEEQSLLILRIDRGLEWKELALVMGEVDPNAGEEELSRASARLRTRFKVAKAKLRKLAEAEGLLRLPTEPAAHGDEAASDPPADARKRPPGPEA